MHANASRHSNRDYEQIAREILQEAAEVDAAEGEQFGDRRGDELPEELSTAQGRRGWLREAKRQLDAQRERQARPIPALRPARLKESRRRLEEESWTECRANEAYAAYRARGVMKDGRRFGGLPKPYTPRLVAPRPDGHDRQSRHRGLDPARRRQTQRRATGLERRPLRIHAPRP